LTLIWLSLQGYEEERPGDAGPGAGGGTRAWRVLLRDKCFHLLRCKRSVWKFDTRCLDRAPPATFLDDESEEGAKTSVAGTRECNVCISDQFFYDRSPELSFACEQINFILPLTLNQDPSRPPRGLRSVLVVINLDFVQQAPFCPPKPVPPEMCLAASTYEENMKSLWTRPVHTDVTLIAGNCTFLAHRCLLAAASPTFHRLFSVELAHELTPRSSSESSMVYASSIRFGGSNRITQ